MKTDCYIVTTLSAPENLTTPAFREMYEKFARRILWMDSNVVPGAFQMNTAWYFGVPEKDPVFEEHSHNSDELIGFFGSDPNNPNDLGGEIVVTLDGEEHTITNSVMIFVPAGMSHMPLSIRRVDRPIFHFSVVTEGHYEGGAYR